MLKRKRMGEMERVFRNSVAFCCHYTIEKICRIIRKTGHQRSWHYYEVLPDFGWLECGKPCLEFLAPIGPDHLVTLKRKQNGIEQLTRTSQVCFYCQVRGSQ